MVSSWYYKKQQVIIAYPFNHFTIDVIIDNFQISRNSLDSDFYCAELKRGTSFMFFINPSVVKLGIKKQVSQEKYSSSYVELILIFAIKYDRIQI